MSLVLFMLNKNSSAAPPSGQAEAVQVLQVGVEQVRPVAAALQFSGVSCDHREADRCAASKCCCAIDRESGSNLYF